MPDVPNREKLERQLARAINKEHQGIFDELMELLGDPPDIGNVPIAFWHDGGRVIQAAVVPILEGIFRDQALLLADTITIGVDWTLVNQAAIDWARGVTGELVLEMSATTQRWARDAVADFYEQGWSWEQLEKQIYERVFDHRRAEMIAITEVTRASVEGEKALINLLLQESGIRMRPFWNTAMDDLVCILCSPKNDKEITDGVFPPLHPRCRCGVSWRLPEQE